MLNDAVVAPAGIVTLDAVGAAIVLLLVERATTVPPAGAAHSSVTVPLTVDPPLAGFGNSGGTTVSVGLTVTRPYVAEISTGVGSHTTFGMMLNARDGEPE